MADITVNAVTSVPYTTGVPNSTIDAINDVLAQANLAIAEINLAGGDTMGDIVPTAAETAAVTAKSLTQADVKSGAVSVSASKTTESVTAGFTVVSVIFNNELGTAPGVVFVATTSAATAITVTFTRQTTAAADVINYILLGA